MTAKQLIDKYRNCPLVGDHPGETPPRVGEMPNHRAEAFIDGISYFTAIREEIRTLGTTTPNRFFYMTAWWLRLRMIPVMNSSLAEKKRGDLLIPDNFAPTKCGIDLGYSKPISRLVEGKLRSHSILFDR
jgi:hypothetical protein